MTKLLLLCLIFLAVFVSEASGRRRREGDPPPPPPPPPGGPPPPPPPRGGPPPPRGPPPPGGGPVTKAKSYPKKWNWKKVAGAAPEGTYFKGKTTPSLTNPTFFDSLFEAKDVPKVDPKKEKEHPPLPTIMDGKRAMAVAIIMKKLKLDRDHAIQEIQAIITDFKVTDADRFRQLLTFVPTKDEIKAVQESTTEASRYSDGDQVIIALAKTDKLTEKMNAARAMSMYDEEFKSLEKSITRLITGLETVEKSTKLAAIINGAWAIGAVINKGGNAFPISALLSLDGAKDSKTGMTYLHYLVAMLQKSNPDSLKLYEEAALLDKPLGPSKAALLETLDAFTGAFDKLQELASIPVVKKFYDDHSQDVNGLKAKFQTATQAFSRVYKFYILDEKEAGDDLASVLDKLSSNLKVTAATMVSGGKPGVIDLDKGTLEVLEKEKSGGGKKDDPKKSDPKKDPKKDQGKPRGLFGKRNHQSS